MRNVPPEIRIMPSVSELPGLELSSRCRSTCDPGSTYVPMPASFARAQQEVELDRSPIYGCKNKNPVQRARRLGTGRRGDVASRVSMRLANHNGSLEPVSLDRRDHPVDWTVVQCGNVTVK